MPTPRGDGVVLPGPKALTKWEMRRWTEAGEDAAESGPWLRLTQRERRSSDRRRRMGPEGCRQKVGEDSIRRAKKVGNRPGRKMRTEIGGKGWIFFHSLTGCAETRTGSEVVVDEFLGGFHILESLFDLGASLATHELVSKVLASSSAPELELDSAS